MLEVIAENKRLDVEQETIKYTKVGNDIGDLQSRETDFTDSLSLPKTANNIQIFEGLGLKNDTSDFPYRKVTGNILDNGLPLFRDGWLNVKETTNEFKVFLYSGLIDLFKAIENKTFGDDVDLIEIDHDKTVANIIASFTNQNYKYIINDFGGKTHIDGNKINTDYLVPSVRVKYLWNKIFTTFGFSYLGNIFNTWDFDTLWLTYPKGVTPEAEPVEYADLQITSTSGYINATINNQATWQIINLTQGTLINSWQYVIPSTGSYSIDYSMFSYITYKSAPFHPSPHTTYKNGYYSLRVNGTAIETHYANNQNHTIQLQLNTGDIVVLYFEPPAPTIQYTNPLNNLTQTLYLKYDRLVYSANLNISKYENVVISFSEELKQLKITDFFKEILWLFGLTIFIDKEGNYVFKTFNERLQADVIDWTDKYIERTSETYTPKTYGQKNRFRQEYQDSRNDYNDGIFEIPNENLNAETTILSSKIFSAEKDQIPFYLNVNDFEPVYPTLLWDKEVSENNGLQEVNYKSLSKRFYFLREESINVSATFKSEIMGNQQTVSSLPIARFLNTSFKDFIPNYYENISLLLNDFRMHKFKINLNSIYFINLDFDKLYYFKQEQNYYFLNKVTYEDKKEATVEAYRVKYTESTTFSYSLFINSYIGNTIEFTEVIPYTKFQIIIEIIGVQFLSAIYSNPLSGYNFTSGTQIRFRDIDTNEILSNTFIIP